MCSLDLSKQELEEIFDSFIVRSTDTARLLKYYPSICNVLDIVTHANGVRYTIFTWPGASKNVFCVELKIPKKVILEIDLTVPDNIPYSCIEYIEYVIDAYAEKHYKPAQFQPDYEKLTRSNMEIRMYSSSNGTIVTTLLGDVTGGAERMYKLYICLSTGIVFEREIPIFNQEELSTQDITSYLRSERDASIKYLLGK